MPSPPPAPLPPPPSSREAGELKSANEKSFRFLAGQLLLPIDKESVSSYFGTPLLFIFAWLIMGKITKEPFVCRQPESGGKNMFCSTKTIFYAQHLAYFPKKQYLCTRSGLVGVHIY